MTPTLLIFGLGYCGRTVATAVADAMPAWRVIGTVRDPAAHAPDGLERIAFGDAGAVIPSATHILITHPPQDGHDPARACEAALAGATGLAWIGYYSTTGVYGDADGARVFEDTPPRPSGARGAARVAAETFWRGIAQASGADCDIMRLGGIYGPGRSALDQLRAGTARRIVSDRHVFSRIHRDDIVRATLRAMATAPQSVGESGPHGATSTRIFNFVDDSPTPAHVAVEHAARLLDRAPPPALGLEEAWPDMSPMARGFWSDRRMVDNARTKALLGLEWRYPDIECGLEALAGSPPP